MVHDFDDSLKRGHDGEDRVVRFLADEFGHKLRPSSKAEQFRGIDYHVHDPSTGRRFTIEIKTDEVAQHTDNIFVETVSNDTTGRKGWAYTCKADFLLYWVKGIDVVYVVQPRKLLTRLDEWKKYRQAGAQNRGYRTLGRLVPMREFEALADKALSL